MSHESTVMLRINGIESIDLPIHVEVDPYVPIAARTYTVPMGSVFYRVGNFETSLVEVPIDPMTGLIRGVKVVFFDRMGTAIDDSRLTKHYGLPVVARESMPNNPQDDHREVLVTLDENLFVVHWSDGQQIDAKVELGRLAFFLGGDSLLGAAVGSLTRFEREVLRTHLSKI